MQQWQFHQLNSILNIAQVWTNLSILFIVCIKIDAQDNVEFIFENGIFLFTFLNRMKGHPISTLNEHHQINQIGGHRIWWLASEIAGIQNENNIRFYNWNVDLDSIKKSIHFCFIWNVFQTIFVIIKWWKWMLLANHFEWAMHMNSWPKKEKKNYFHCNSLKLTLFLALLSGIWGYAEMR